MLVQLPWQRVAMFKVSLLEGQSAANEVSGQDDKLHLSIFWLTCPSHMWLHPQLSPAKLIANLPSDGILPGERARKQERKRVLQSAFCQEKEQGSKKESEFYSQCDPCCIIQEGPTFRSVAAALRLSASAWHRSSQPSSMHAVLMHSETIVYF